jgi:hypothetical protein
MLQRTLHKPAKYLVVIDAGGEREDAEVYTLDV